MTFCACDSNNPDNPSLKEVHELAIDVLSEDIHPDSPYIRLMAECDEWVLFDIKQDGLENDSSRSFAFMSKEEQIGYYLYATTDFVLMSQFTDDPTESLINGNVLVTHCTDKYTRCSVVKDFFGRQEILSETVIAEDIHIAKLPKKDNYAASIRNTISKHFKDGAKQISEKISQLDWIIPDKIEPNGLDVIDMWYIYAAAASTHQIEEFNPELKDVQHEQIAADNAYYIDLLIRKSPLLDFALKVKDKIKNALAIGKQWFQKGEVEDNEDSTQMI